MSCVLDLLSNDVPHTFIGISGTRTLILVLHQYVQREFKIIHNNSTQTVLTCLDTSINKTHLILNYTYLNITRGISTFVQ